MNRELLVVVLFLAFTGCFAADNVEEDEEASSGDIGGEPCLRYCESTYPPHTYPQPEDTAACTRGCRMAQIDALLAWPLSPDHNGCVNTCHEGYFSNAKQTFACTVGCNASTIDRMIPNREHLYPQDPDDSDDGIVMAMFAALRQQLPMMFVVDDDVMQLEQHADEMMNISPFYRVVIIEDGNMVEIQYKYGLDYNLQPEFYVVQEESYDSIQYCPWKTLQYSALGRFLFFLATCFMVAAVVTCCCASCVSEEEGETKEEKLPPPPMKSFGKDMFVETTLKSPLTFSMGYPQPPFTSHKK